MFAASKTSAPSGGPADAQFNYVTMLLHGDGTNGAQNNTFLDSSTNNFSITRNGNTTQGSFSPYGSNWSNYFPTDYIYTTSSIGSYASNFTIECWVNAKDDGPVPWCLGDCATSSGLDIQLFTTNVDVITNGSALASFTTSAWKTKTWTHVAVVRNSGTITVYVNGTSVGTVSHSATLSGSFYLAAQKFGGSVGNGGVQYLSNLRVTNTAVYTSNFTPSTTPLTAISGTALLTCQSNRFIDNSSNAYALTIIGTNSVQRFNPFGTSTAYSTSVIGGSGYFDKSGDYLDGPTNSAFAFGTGDFTISAWVYILNGTSSQIIWTNQTTSSANAPNLVFFILSNNVCIANTNTAHIASSGTIANNSWNYVGVTKSSGTYTFYINGSTSGTTSSIGTDNITENACHIGYGNYGTNYYFGGYIADLRIIKGSAVTPTVPTAPVGTVTNTQLLLNMTNGAIYDNAMMNDLETVGNAQISTSVKKFGTGSLAFDGSGDWLSIVNAVPLNTGALTCEAWIYLTSLTGYQTMYDSRPSTGSGAGFTVQVNPSGTVEAYSGGSMALTSTTLSTGQWYHIAFVRNSSNACAIYINGVSSGTGSGSNNFTNASVNIGKTPDNYYFNGYIDDLRITKGYARYTTNFTPPTAAFSNTGPN